MATSYSSKLRLALPVQGELTGTWGDTVNDEITSMVEEAVAGFTTINSWTTNSHTLTTLNGITDEARSAMLSLENGSGGTALTGAGTLICPSTSKIYTVINGASYAVTVKTSAGTGVSIPAGSTDIVFCDGTNVENITGQSITAAQWGYLANMDQNVATTSSITVGDLTSTNESDFENGLKTSGGVRDALSLGDGKLYGAGSQGASLYGYGTTYDTSLLDRNGDIALGVEANSKNIQLGGQLTLNPATGDTRLFFSRGGLSKFNITTLGSTDNTRINASAGELALQTNSTDALSFDTSQNATFSGDVTLTEGSLSAYDTGGLPLRLDAPAGANTNIEFSRAGAVKWYMRNTTGDDFSLYNNVTATEVVNVDSATNNTTFSGNITASGLTHQFGQLGGDSRLTCYSNTNFQFAASNNEGKEVYFGATNTTGTSPSAVISNNAGTPLLTITDAGGATFSGSASLSSNLNLSGGSFSAPASGDGSVYSDATLGLVLTGKGATHDVYIANSVGSDVLTVPTGTTNVYLGGDLEVESNTTFNGDVTIDRASGNAAKTAYESGATSMEVGYQDGGSGRGYISNLNNSGGTNNYITLGFGAATAGVPSLSVMRVYQTGDAHFIGNAGFGVVPTSGRIHADNNGQLSTTNLYLEDTDTAGSFSQVIFANYNGIVGSISTSGTATAYNVSSDPRLKQFIETDLTDTEIDAQFDKLHSSSRRFKWKNDLEGKTVWGFDAHACIDAGLDMGTEGQGPRNLEIGDTYTDEDGDEQTVTPAGVDQSKAVPILLAKIEQLERRLAALEA